MIEFLNDVKNFIISHSSLTKLLVVVQGQRMDTDVRIDDKFLPRQPDPLVRQLRLKKSFFRHTDIHHDLGSGGRNIVKVQGLNDEFEIARIDVARFPLDAGHRDLLPILDHLGAVFRADDAGDPQFPGDDCRMAGSAAAIGDDSARNLHDWLPVGIRHVGDQNLARLEIMHLTHGLQEANRPLPYLGTDRLTACQERPCFLEHIGFDCLFTGLGMHGFRPGLHDEQVASPDLLAIAVFGPLDIHGAAVMILNDAGPARQLQNLVVTQNIGTTFLLGGINIFYRLFGTGRVVVHHFDFFGAHPLADNRPFALFERRFENIIFVRIDRSLDDILTQSPGTSQKNRIFKARLGIDGEHHPGAGGIGTHHLLHHDRQIDVKLAKTFIMTIRNGAVGE